MFVLPLLLPLLDGGLIGVPGDTIGSLEEPLLLPLFSLDGGVVGVVMGGTVEGLLFPVLPPLLEIFPFSSTMILMQKIPLGGIKKQVNLAL